MDKIALYIFAIVGGGLGIASTVYLLVSAIYTIGYKVYRKVKYGYSLYD